MKDNNYEFRVGDEVETVDGMSGKIVLICHCERCAERGFFEPKWETSDGKYSDYITVNQANWGFPYYRRIGKCVWNHDANEEKSTKNIFKKENKKMKEIKLTIDGKEVQLTDEQLKVLGVEIEEKRKNPFKRVTTGDTYYKITGYGNVDNFREDGDSTDQALYDGVNYFNDDSVAQQVALHQLLYRKLLKFAYDNNCIDTTKWRRYSQHWFIYYDWDTKEIRPDLAIVAKQFSTIYFSTMKAAQRAINEVVKPFMKEHPEFVW